MFVTALSLTVNYLEKNVDIDTSQDRNWNMNSASYNSMIRKSKDRRYRKCLWMLTRPKVQWTCLLSKPIFFSVLADVCVTTCTYINQMSPGLVHKCTWTKPCRRGRCYTVLVRTAYQGLSDESLVNQNALYLSQSSVCVLLIINFSFNLPKASNMKRVRNKLWKNVCSLLFNNGRGRRWREKKWRGLAFLW